MRTAFSTTSLAFVFAAILALPACVTDTTDTSDQEATDTFLYGLSEAEVTALLPLASSPMGSPDYSDCTNRTATEATCTFDPAYGNWSAEGTPSSIASAEVSLCLAHDPDAKCMWSWDVEPGTVVPYTGVNGTYECGGKTCNGVPTNQVMHVGGQEYTLRLTEDGCSGAL